MRCPDCNKFVSYDADTEPEVDVEVDDDGRVTGTVRIVNCCGECSGELKETTFDVDVDMTSEVSAHKAKYPDVEHTITLNACEGERTERSQTHDRNGRPIKNRRYAKYYYGASVQIEVGCSCGQEVEGGETTWEDEVPASGMDELV